MAKQKYEREIAEILERLDRQGRGTVQPRDEPAEPAEPPRLARFASSLGAPASWTNRVWLALSVGLPLLAVLVYRAEPLLGSVLVLAGIFLFLSPLALALVGLVRAEKRPCGVAASSRYPTAPAAWPPVGASACGPGGSAGSAGGAGDDNS